MRCLVIGHGSIGRRHVDVLRALGHDVAVVSRRGGTERPTWPDAAAALAAGGAGYAVVATETAHHRAALEALAAAGFAGRVLVEKPLLAEPEPLPGHGFAGLHVGYQLRFDPLVMALRRALQGRRVLAAAFRVGQNLADWRPGRDHSQVYSASRAAGGGVLRDLSHELDLMLWLLGPWRRVAAVGGNTGRLGIAAEEVAVLLGETAACAHVVVHLDCLARPARRRIELETDAGSLTADLIAGTLDGDGDVETFPRVRDDAFAGMHRAVLAGGGEAATVEDGMAVVALIDAAERAIAGRTWIAAA